jgi:hypothetical protein
MGSTRTVALTLVLVVGFAACSFGPAPAVLVFHNRSDAPIALYPDVTIAACSTMERDQAAIDRGKARFDAEFASTGVFDSWVPPGAVQYRSAIPGHRIGATEPLTVVVSGVAEPRFVEGRVPDSGLPDCGGQPVGIS